ncbi:hypothetical protein ACIBXA_32250 [Micromonospora echinaurantiaca]|uniref:hypothetical protein n=1 Tax=Micromonospora echinaurantiaca TaxID=47857 RepID=UPI00378EE437
MDGEDVADLDKAEPGAAARVIVFLRTGTSFLRIEAGTGRFVARARVFDSP